MSSSLLLLLSVTLLSITCIQATFVLNITNYNIPSLSDAYYCRPPLVYNSVNTSVLAIIQSPIDNSVARLTISLGSSSTPTYTINTLPQVLNPTAIYTLPSTTTPSSLRYVLAAHNQSHCPTVISWSDTNNVDWEWTAAFSAGTIEVSKFTVANGVVVYQTYDNTVWAAAVNGGENTLWVSETFPYSYLSTDSNGMLYFASPASSQLLQVNSTNGQILTSTYLANALSPTFSAPMTAAHSFSTSDTNYLVLPHCSSNTGQLSLALFTAEIGAIQQIYDIPLSNLPPNNCFGICDNYVPTVSADETVFYFACACRVKHFCGSDASFVLAVASGKNTSVGAGTVLWITPVPSMYSSESPLLLKSGRIVVHAASATLVSIDSQTGAIYKQVTESAGQQFDDLSATLAVNGDRALLCGSSGSNTICFYESM